MKRFLPLLILCLSVSLASAQNLPAPSDFLKLNVGADRTLADYHQIESYFAALAAASPRVEVEDLGPTTLGNRMIMAVISSEANVANLPRLREVAAKLADPRGLSDAEAAKLVGEGKSIVLLTCNIHSTEIASSQMAMEWASKLASSRDPEVERWLDNVVLLLVPSLNPDGQIMVVDWYRKYVGTKYEGSPLPWLYHHYVGHDNNRDWYMLTQKETRDLTRAIYHRWFPQVFVDLHQMGSTGPRIFIPPFSDPMDPDIHPLIWREIGLIGASMAYRLEQSGRSGAISGYSFDAYWPGGTRNTGWWKNITGLLIETASADIATPVYVYPSELEGGRKGLIEYKPQVNYPNPWEGGWWHMRDIMDYQEIVSNALLEVAADRREDLLRDLLTRSRAAVASAAPREAYLIPHAQRDYPTAMRLAKLMADHGVEVTEAKNGDFWIPLAQPYSAFVREMMEPQRYPEIRLTDQSGILAPYDVSTWSLPLLMGVEVEKAKMPSSIEGKALRAPILDEGKAVRTPALEPAKAPYYAVSHASPESAKVVNAILASGGSVSVGSAAVEDLVQAPVPVRLEPGTFYFPASALPAALEPAAETGVALLPLTARPADATPLKHARVAVYKPWTRPSMDEGWTRFVLEQYGFAIQSIDPRGVKEGAKGAGLRQKFDVIILPDISREMIATGEPRVREGAINYAAPMPPEYRGGLGPEGAEALKRFVDAGGTLIGFENSCDYILSNFNLPVANALAGRRVGRTFPPRVPWCG